MSGDRFYLIPAGLAGVLLLCGGVLVAVGSLLASAAEERRAWPSNDAVVIENWRATEPTRIRDSKTGNTHEVWGEVLEYTYVIDGREYTGKGSGYGQVDPLEADTRWPVGAKVPVFYDPEEPDHSALTLDTLEPGEIRTPFYWAGFGVMLLGVPFGYLSWRVKRGGTGQS